MAKLLKIEQYGDQMKAIFDDNTSVLAVPTVGGLWYATDAYVPPTPPPPAPSTPSGQFMWPFDPRKAPWAGGVQGGTVTSEYGQRNGRLHAGIDMAPGAGVPIRAAGAGRVQISSGSHGGYGQAIVIDHGGGIATLYGHMIAGSRTVGVGAQVEKGQVIGQVGNTGASFGAHLHFETHTGGYRWNASSMNPRDFMARYGL
jgi:murein DD-endopeptidase MepM/ murein hydrolase activator NlpD